VRQRSHKAAQSASHGLRHRVFGGAVKDHAVDDRVDDHAWGHERPDGVGYILAIAPETVNPPHHRHVTGMREVKHATTAWPFIPTSVTTSSNTNPADYAWSR